MATRVTGGCRSGKNSENPGDRWTPVRPLLHRRRDPIDGSEAMDRFLAVEATAGLSEAEAGVLRMLVGFLTATEIAGALGLPPGAVRAHTTAIYRKLGVRRRRDAVRRARELGLV
jgi:ATP/maltotriose-dependent transcriptional regulator MalT